MYNKKVLSTAVSKLGSAKAPAKKRDKVYTNKEALSPFVSSEGFKQGPPPAGTNYRIPGDTLYNPTPYSIEAVSDNGIRKTLNPNDTTNVQFPGATYVDEYQMGGEDYYEDELTDDEIEELRRGGYIVEDISIPSVGGYKKGGALLTKKVTCKNCGWSWDAADGGNDLTTCHKCGGKGLIHAQTGGPLPKAQLGKNKVTLEASPFSLNANQAQLASDVYGEYDPEFLIGASIPIGGSRDPRIANSLSLTAGLPLNGTAVPSINAGYKFRYRPSSMNAGAFAPTTQLDVGAGWDPTQGLNFQAKANPRWEFANRRADAYLKHNWPVGAWRGYAGPSGGLNLRQNSFVPGLAGYGTQEKTAGNINLFYGAEAGIEGRPFKKTPLRVGLDAGLLMNLAKKQAEESFNPETDFGKSATGFTPMLKAKVVYPLGTAYPKKKEASEEKVRLDAARANDKNYQVDAPTITGPGVDWDYENRPEQSGVPVGYLPGYEPETGRQLTEEELMQRYSPALKKGGEKKYSRSLSAKNRLFVENKLTKKQKSKKKKIFDPKAKYFQDGGTNQVECDDDGRCYETDQAQELLDKTHKTIGTALNMDRYIAEQVWNGAPANKEWQKLGVRTADQITGDPNAFACANSATRGYEACDPQAVNDADTLSNARMKSAVAAGRTPFRKVATHKDNDFLYGNDLKPGQLISFMGDGTNHMIKYYGDNFNGDQRAFMQSNGNVDDWSFMTDAGWLPNVPSTVYEYAPHYDEIQALEEQARTNPTYVPGTSSVGTLPIRQPASLPIAESERQLPAVAGDLGMRKVGGVPELPLNQNRQVLRDWVYGQSIGMLQEDDGGYMDLDLSDEEIQRMKDLGYYVEEY